MSGIRWHNFWLDVWDYLKVMAWLVPLCALGGIATLWVVR